VGGTAIGDAHGLVVSEHDKVPAVAAVPLMTLGPALCHLAALDGRTPAILRPLLTFGRVPLFYYLVHLTLIHLLAVAVAICSTAASTGCSSRRASISFRLRARRVGI
jgi:uncharacterized membrane protein